ncbi:MAG: hypothetical protein ACI9HX_000667 [Pseudoalteromonas tetraodonis]|jgi:hypothetical protein
MSSVLAALKKAERERREAISPLVLGVTASRAVTKGGRDFDWRSVCWVVLISLNVALGIWLLFGNLTVARLLPEQGRQIVAVPAEPAISRQPVGSSANPLASNALPTVEIAERLSPSIAVNVSGLQSIEFDLPRARGSSGLSSYQVAIQGRDNEEQDSGAAAETAVDALDEESNSPSPYAGDAFKSRKLGAHIFSDTPSRRMVMLDGQPYRQGERMPDGWILIEIGREQLVVEQLGRRYSVWLSDIR